MHGEYSLGKLAAFDVGFHSSINGHFRVDILIIRVHCISSLINPAVELARATPKQNIRGEVEIIKQLSL